MFNRLRLLILCAICLSQAACASTVGKLGLITYAKVTNTSVGLAKSPWPKYHRDGANSGTGIGKDATGKVEWSLQIQAVSDPVIGPDGTLYIHTQDGLDALSPSGSVLWQKPLGVIDPSTPALGSNRILYVGSGNSLCAVDSATGHLKWRYVTADIIDNSPTISTTGVVYFTSEDNCVYALDERSGNLKWKKLMSSPVWSSPAIGSDGTIYIGSNDDCLYALNGLTGSIKWKVKTGGRVIASPMVDSKGVIYSGSIDGCLYAIEPTMGSILWKTNLASHEDTVSTDISTCPALLDDDKLCVTGGNCIYILLRSTGSILQQIDVGTFAGDFSPVSTGDGVVYVGTQSVDLETKPSGHIIGVDTHTGKILWSLDTSEVLSVSAAIGEDGTLYMRDDAKILYAIK